MAKYFSHHDPKIESAHMDQQPLEYVFMAAKMRSSHASRVVNVSKRTLHQFPPVQIHLKKLVLLSKEWGYPQFKTAEGKTKPVKTYFFKGKLKDCNVSLKFVILFGSYGKKDQKKVHILITNKTRLSAQNIVDFYRLRRGIENCYRELKDFFMMDQYQVRKRRRIERHWALCHVAWTMAYWIKQNGYLHKIVSYSAENLNQVMLAINDIIDFQQTISVAKRPEELAKKFKITSARIHNKAG